MKHMEEMIKATPLRITIVPTYEEYDNFIEEFVQENYENILRYCKLKNSTLISLEDGTIVSITPFSECGFRGRKYHQLFITKKAYSEYINLIPEVLLPRLVNFPYDINEKYKIQIIE